MAKQASQTGGLSLIIGAIIIYFVFSPMLTLIVYGTLPFIVGGLIVAEIRSRPRPAVTTKEEFAAANHLRYFDSERSTLRSLDERQDELRSQKRRAYWLGDQRGLNRREHDGRFYARGEGKRINAELAKLDEAFIDLDDQKSLIERSAADRLQKQADEFTGWRSKHDWVVVFRIGILIYACAVAVVVILDPVWTQKLSQFVSRSIWFPVPALSRLYGPLTIASVLAIGAGAICRMTRETISVQVADIRTMTAISNERVSEFMEPEETAEIQQSDEGEEFEGDANEGRDEHNASSPYEILGVSTEASREDIMTAYRELVKQYHPDFQQSRGAKLKELAERETQLLNWAKEEALKKCQ